MGDYLNVFNAFSIKGDAAAETYRPAALWGVHVRSESITRKGIAMGNHWIYSIKYQGT